MIPFNVLKKTTALAMIATLFLTALAFAAEAPQSVTETPEPLVIAPTNTVILDYSGVAGRLLQQYLLKAVAKIPNADGYRLDVKPAPDRAASGAFPLFRNAKEIPAGKNVLVVGRASQLNEPYLSDQDRQKLNERDGSILIRRQGNVVVIANSGDDSGSLAGVRIFLDRCAGVRMYAPSDDDLWLSRPKDNQFTVGNLDLFIQPYFAKTAFSYFSPAASLPRNQAWERMNTPVSENNPLRGNHSIIQYFNPAKYYDKYPEIYPMAADGTRPRPTGTAWNPSLENPELLAKIAMDEVRERMHSKNPPTYLSFGVMDCPFTSQDPISRAERKKYNGSMSNLYYTFLNKVAKECQKEFPKLYLTSYVYSNVKDPPVGMTIEPNIVVDVVTKSYNWENPDQLAVEKNRILEYAGLGASWVTHDWNFSGVTPRIYSQQWAMFLQWAVQNHMKGIYIEWSSGEAWYVDGAKYWVLRQLLSNPYQDVDALWRQYCNDMYGPAGEEMYRFYDMFAEKHIYSDKYYQRDDMPRQEMAGFTPQDLVLQRGFLETAIAKTKNDPLIQKRLALVMRYFRGHELYAEAVGEPVRQYHTYTTLDKQTGINQAALAFYVNDDGKKLLEAMDYYDHKRTIPPDNNGLAMLLGGPLSYLANYSRALGTILLAVRNQALQGIDLNQVTPQTPPTVAEKSVALYRANLPPKYDQTRAKYLESFFQKILWIPRSQEMPKIDGVLDDPAWKTAADLSGFTVADLLLPTQAGNETEGKIMRVGDTLVIGLVCQQPQGIWAETTPDVKTGTRIWRESCAEIFFGPHPKEGEKPAFFQYIVNSLGAFRGFQTAADNREGVQCAVKLDKAKGEYTIEVALPLKTKDYDYTQEHVFDFTIMREVYHGNTTSPAERLGWHPLFFSAIYPESRGLVFLQ